MNAKLELAEDIFLDKINQICSKFGLNNIMAQLYAILYFSDNHLSLDDMVERLKISKGSASVNIRALERYGVVRKVWVRGSRKDYYEAEKDIAKVILGRIKSMAQHRLSEVDDMLNAAYGALGSVDAKTADEIKEIEAFRHKLEKLKDFHGKANSLFELFNSNILEGMLNNVDAEPPTGSALQESSSRA